MPFYHRKFDRAGIKPDDITSISDSSMIPFTTKSEIQASPFVDVIARNVDMDRCVKKTTSGSTGIPLTVVYDGVAEGFSGALWARAYMENGLRRRDKMAVIQHPRFMGRKRISEFFGINRRKYISVFDAAERQLRLLEDFKPDVIKGYSSSLAILANYCKNQVSSVKPRLVFTGAD